MKDIFNERHIKMRAILLFLGFGAMLLATTALAPIAEIGVGYGYMSYDLVDRGQSKYTLKDNRYSGGFIKAYAHMGFPINSVKLGAGVFAEFPNFSNNVMTSTSSIGVSFPWNRFGAEGKLSFEWIAAISPYGRFALGYESWKVNGSYAGSSFEYGTFRGTYGEAGIGADFNPLSLLHIFVELGVSVGYQTGRFLDPNASLATNNLVYYDTSTRTRGVYALAGVSLNF